LGVELGCWWVGLVGWVGGLGWWVGLVGWVGGLGWWGVLGVGLGV